MFSYLKPDDAFNATFDHARDFVQRMKRLTPDMRLLAWIGAPVAVDQLMVMAYDSGLVFPRD